MPNDPENYLVFAVEKSSELGRTIKFITKHKYCFGFSVYEFSEFTPHTIILQVFDIDRKSVV